MGIEKFEKNVKNPFVNPELLLDIKNKQIKLGIHMDDTRLIDNDTGEVKKVYGYTYTKQVVDSSKFIKLYVSNMRTIFGLSKRSQKVMEYVCIRLPINKDFIYLDLEECMEFCGYSTKQSVYNGLNDLLNSSIIARTNEVYKYWINPSVVYNGNRLIVINEYVEELKNIKTIEIQEGTEEDKQLEVKFKESKLNKE